MREKVQRKKHIPANSNILKRKLVVGDVVNIHKVDVTIQHIRRHKLVGDSTDRDFVYYMISVDPRGLAWYHASKQEGGLRESV